MDNELIRQSDIKPVAFNDIMVNRPRFSGHYLLKLLKDKMEAGQPITRDDISETYIKTCSKDGVTIRIRYNLHFGKTNAIQADKSHPIVKQRALAWFKLNLGAAIIKGKLLVIPIIEIE